MPDGPEYAHAGRLDCLKLGTTISAQQPGVRGDVANILSRSAPQLGRRVSVRSAPVVTVRCAGCGVSFDLSARNEFEHRRHGMPHRCPYCRRGASPSAAMVVKMRGWWLERYSLGELRSWPPLGRR